MLMKLGLEVNLNGKRPKVSNGIARTIFLPTSPTSLTLWHRANFAIIYAILMKFRMVLIAVRLKPKSGYIVGDMLNRPIRWWESQI